jgi:flagellar biosynthesis/type III secretory pathway protein FliH
MSSFDALVPAPAPAGGESAAADFVPLRPPGAAEVSGAEGWRPLLAALGGSMDGDGVPEPSGGGGADGDAGPGSGPADGASAMAAGRAQGPAVPAGGGSELLAAEYERGRREARADVEAAAESLVRSLEALAAFRAGLGPRYERALCELAVDVAAKVLRAELRERPEAWLDMIRDGVRQAVDREQVRVRVPAVLAAFLRERLPALQARLEDVKALEIVEDLALDPGGCIIETHFGELDLGLDAQIEQLRRGLGEERS